MLVPRVDAKTLAAVRDVVGHVQRNAEFDADKFLKRMRVAFDTAAGFSGKLDKAGLERAMQAMAHAKEGDSTGMEAAAAQLAPLLFQLMDADRSGEVKLDEFMMGQALIYAAARANGPGELTELCWRALDTDGDGSVDRNELAAFVSLMVRLGAVRAADLKVVEEQWVYMKKGDKQEKYLVGCRARYRTEEELAAHYMAMYDQDFDGKISREEFEACSALRENFWLLITQKSSAPLFLVRSKSLLGRA